MIQDKFIPPSAGGIGWLRPLLFKGREILSAQNRGLRSTQGPPGGRREACAKILGAKNRCLRLPRGLPEAVGVLRPRIWSPRILI